MLKLITLAMLVAIIVGCQAPPTFFHADEQSVSLYTSAHDQRTYIEGYSQGVIATATYPHADIKPHYTATAGPYITGWRAGQQEVYSALSQDLVRSLILGECGDEEMEVDGFLRLQFGS